jgi:pimeloyl-ACP methyl ester carboxylesterase
MDQYTEALAAYPNADGNIDFVGHSNGTYVLARALQDYHTLSVNRVVFAGSVVRRDYDWDGALAREQVKRVRNYVASADWVVALFPHFFELPIVSSVFSANDIGGAGFDGFQRKGDNVHEIHYVEGGHAAALDERNLPSIVDFLMNDPAKAPAAPLVPRQPGWLQEASNVCWLVWLVIVSLVLAAGWGVARLAKSQWKVPRRWSAAIFAFIVWLLLYTV